MDFWFYPTGQISCKTTDFYLPSAERTIVWSDADLHIEWPVTTELIISPKDAAGIHFRDAETFA